MRRAAKARGKASLWVSCNSTMSRRNASAAMQAAAVHGAVANEQRPLVLGR